MVEELSLVPIEDEPRSYHAKNAGMAALAVMSNDDFETRLAGLKRGTERVQRIHRELMKEGDDYGVIPGTGQKPTLLKPGAERLCLFYGLVAEFRPQISYRDHEADDVPAIHVLTECRLHLGDVDGPVVASGHGAANSFERKYRYRRGERACPECGVIGSIIKGKKEWGGGWTCWAKKGGCGAKFGENVPAIVDQVVGDVENPDPWDLQNTLVKMAEKRSFVTATLRATGTSSLYVQDMEEVSHVSGDDRKPAMGRVVEVQTRPPLVIEEDEEERPDPFEGDDTPATPRAVNQAGSANGASMCAEPGCQVLLTPGQKTISERRYGKPFCHAHQAGKPVNTGIA